MNLSTAIQAILGYYEPLPQWMKELEARVFETSRPVKIYHWASREKIGVNKNGPVNPRHPAVKRYLTSMTRWRHNNPTKETGGVMGDGVYYALDPALSRSYGEGNALAAVLETTLKRGTRILNLSGEQNFSDPAQTELLNQGCIVTSVRDVCANPWCTQLCSRALERLEIAGIGYYFDNSEVCPTTHAVVLTSPRVAYTADTTVLVSDIPAHDPVSSGRQRIAHFLRLYRKGAGGNPPLWGELPVSKEIMDSHKDWSRQNLLGCSPEQFPEDELITGTPRQWK